MAEIEVIDLVSDNDIAENTTPFGDESRRVTAGTVKSVKTKSSNPGISIDKKLSELERKQHFLRIEDIYKKSKGKTNKQLEDSIKQLYDSSDDAFLSAIFVMASSSDFQKAKPKSLSFLVIDVLEDWRAEYLHLNDTFPHVSDQTVLEAVWAVSGQRNSWLVEKVVDLYVPIRNREKYVGVVRALANEAEFASACRLATALRLTTQFKKEEFIIPLFIQGLYSVAEDYLASNNVALRNEVLEFLDRHVANPRAMISELSEDSAVPNIKYGNLNPKVLSSLINRLKARYGLSKESCPNTTLREIVLGLRYLVRKRFLERSIELVNWEELVNATIGDSVELHVELVKYVCNYCEDTALQWARKLCIPIDRLPLSFQQKLEKASHRPVQGSNAGTEKSHKIIQQPAAPQPTFYKMPSSVKIRMISSLNEFNEFLLDVSRADVVGLDAEWRPCYTRQQVVKVALLQVATKDTVFLIDTHSLRTHTQFNAQHGRRLEDTLFANSNILKLGFALREDISNLSRSLPGLKNLSLENTLDIHMLWTSLKKDHAAMLPSGLASNTFKGLSGVVNVVLGAPLDKREQTSDWERRPLRESQATYAAIDAFCLLQVYEELKKRAAASGVDFKYVVNGTMRGNHQSSRGKKRNRPRGSTGGGTSKRRTLIKQQIQKYKLTSNQITSSQLYSSRPPEFRFVCDTMLHRLGKLLRSCGIDTALAQPDADLSDVCIRLAMDEGRVGLSKGKPFAKLRKYVGSEQCLCIESDKPEVQIQQVLKHFNITVDEKDIFSRCQICNSNLFHRLHQQQVLGMRPDLSLPEESKFSMTDHLPTEERNWNIVETPENVMETRRTAKGVELQLDSIPQGVIESQELFYICVGCGKSYWGGSHLQRVLNGSLKYALNWNQQSSDAPDISEG